MIAPALPIDEAERLADLRALNILDTPPEQRFDRIIALATGVFEVPIAYIALVDANRQWFKAKQGVCARQTDRSVSFCGHTVLQDDPLVIPDARLDERFNDNPMVTGEPNIVFYAGHPLKGLNGHNIGTLCLADFQPRELTESQIAMLIQLAGIAEHELSMVDVIAEQHELIETKNALARTRDHLARELHEAAQYVQSLLPAKLEGGRPSRDIRSDWQFISSSQLGGDIFDYQWLNDHQLAIGLVDVCGHGVASALLSISVRNTLHLKLLRDVAFDDPSQVLAALNRAFPMTDHNNKFFTAWYGVVDASKRTLRYATAGHHPALMFTRGDNGATEKVQLSTPNLMVGVEPDVVFQSDEIEVPKGARIYVFSDGVFEVRNPDGKMLGMDGVTDLLEDRSSEKSSCVDSVLAAIRRYQDHDAFADDFSMLEFCFDA